jgi:precorrin-6B methylase 1
VSRDAAIEVILPEDNGVDKIAEILAKYKDLDAIHIVSHGDQATLELGNMVLNASNITDYQTQLASWGNSLTQSGDILFYGCKVAEGDAGQAFVELIEVLYYLSLK